MVFRSRRSNNLASIWDKVFKNGPSEICRRKPLKKVKGYSLLKQILVYKYYTKWFN